MQDSSPPPWPIALAATTLACLVAAVFLPILDFEFVEYDVAGQVVKNEHIRGLGGDNLKHIFTSRCVTSYYPVRTLSFALDYQLWGLNAGGFKLTNGLIHLANVLLLFWLILRLVGHPAGAVPSPRPRCDLLLATCSAGVFAVHPVVVEPVTWVAGREELLMTLGALGSIHFHIWARRLSEAGDTVRAALGCRVLSVLCCVAACLSNAVAAVIPLLITAWDVLTLDSPKKFRKILYGTWILWVIGLVTIVIKKTGPGIEFFAGQVGTFSAQRPILVLAVYWRNLKTLLWPTDLAIAYSDAPPHGFLDVEVVLGGIATVLTCTLLWMLRRRKLTLFGLIWFAVALSPSSQVMAHHWIRADRFLYLPLAGLAVVAAMGLRALAGTVKGRAVAAGLMACCVLIVLVTYRAGAVQVRIWRSNISLWEHCVRVSPDSSTAHGALADSLAAAGLSARAIAHYKTALGMDPDNKETLNNFALELAACKNKEFHDYRLAIELAELGCQLSQWKDRKLLHTLAMANNNFALDLAGQGKFGQAIRRYRDAIEADPRYVGPLFNLALLLTTCGDEKLRRADEAVRLAERACELTERRDANGLWILAKALAGAGRLDTAVARLEEALGLAQSAGNVELADRLQRELELYRNRASSPSTEN